MATRKRWARLIREHLTDARRAGTPFDKAWKSALDLHHPPMDWDPESLAFACSVFGLAYRRIPVGVAGASIITENAPVAVDSHPRPSARIGDRCRSGDRCDRLRVPGSRFCPEHRDGLALIRDDFEREEGERDVGDRAA